MRGLSFEICGRSDCFNLLLVWSAEVAVILLFFFLFKNNELMTFLSCTTKRFVYDKSP